LDNSTEATENFFKSQFSDAVPLMPTLLHDFKQNPTASLVTVRCYPWSVTDKCCLFGDAAHAIVPFFGQGMNAAFEDCSVFYDCLEEYGTNWQKVFGKYQELRKNNTDAIADMAFENFIEMRDKVADPHFLFMKKVQSYLGNKFPDKFISRYELVSFSRIPYKDAQKFGEAVDRVTRELMDGKTDVSQIDLKLAEELIEKHLTPLQSFHANL